MGDLSAHFSSYEFACKCGACPSLRPANVIVLLLEEGRLHFIEKYGLKVRVIVNSGIRCHVHNEHIGGSENSRHMRGDAADVVFENMEFQTKKWFPLDPTEVYEYYDDRYPDMLGLGLYDNRNHIDGRLWRVRWDERTPQDK